ncbi:CheY-like chemotaxis protein [Hymenobacter sp. 9A]|uniref:CheY-like chemotaxis protein n=1 Tax=Hymenobacter caeli TaxID=2735894 RepID=A0ABX2FWC9_9BACT|nr:CheY-like chemotaxis protein [Hymenobacter caeli]
MVLADQVLVAEVGQAAPRYPELILLDLQMPMLNGLDSSRTYQPPPSAQQSTRTQHSPALSKAQDLAQPPIAGMVAEPLNVEENDHCF